MEVNIAMYKMTTPQQLCFDDFNQSAGLKLDMDNEWCQLAGIIPWEKLEVRYASLFKGTRGHVALPFRIAFGALIIQSRLQLSDRKTVKAVSENPYLQYFLGLAKFQTEAPFSAPLMVTFRKRLNANFIDECNNSIIEELMKIKSEAAENGPKKRGKKKVDKDNVPDETSGNCGTAILDATCAPANIKYPQDYVLLNDAREKLEKMIYWFCDTYGLPKPRTYKRVARQDYLELAKRRKRTEKQIRATVRKMLGYVKRDLGYLEGFMAEGYAPKSKDINMYLTITTLHEQQYYMWKNRTHSVPDRIVSIHQPWIRPIVRGKAKAPTEFGAKFEIVIDESGYGRIMRTSFDAYNESSTFIEALEKYNERKGHYPKRVLADQIYRTRENRQYCKEHGIRISGPKLGRKPKEKEKNVEDKKTEYKDNTDRIEVERFFSLGKRCNGMGLIMTKLKETELTSIAMSVLVSNLFKDPDVLSFFVFFIADYNGDSKQGFCIFDDEDDEDNETVA